MASRWVTFGAFPCSRAKQFERQYEMFARQKQQPDIDEKLRRCEQLIKDKCEEITRLQQDVAEIYRLEAEVEEKTTMEAELNGILKEKVLDPQECCESCIMHHASPPAPGRLAQPFALLSCPLDDCIVRHCSIEGTGLRCNLNDQTLHDEGCEAGMTGSRC